MKSGYFSEGIICGGEVSISTASLSVFDKVVYIKNNCSRSGGGWERFVDMESLISYSEYKINRMSLFMKNFKWYELLSHDNIIF